MRDEKPPVLGIAPRAMAAASRTGPGRKPPNIGTRRMSRHAPQGASRATGQKAHLATQGRRQLNGKGLLAARGTTNQ